MPTRSNTDQKQNRPKARKPTKSNKTSNSNRNQAKQPNKQKKAAKVRGKIMKNQQISQGWDLSVASGADRFEVGRICLLVSCSFFPKDFKPIGIWLLTPLRSGFSENVFVFLFGSSFASMGRPCWRFKEICGSWWLECIEVLQVFLLGPGKSKHLQPHLISVGFWCDFPIYKSFFSKTLLALISSL